MSQLGQEHIVALDYALLCNYLKTNDGLAVDVNGSSLLHIAAIQYATLSTADFAEKYVLLKIMQKLIAYGVPVNLLDNDGNSALFLVICQKALFDGKEEPFRPCPLIEAVSLLQKNWANPDIMCSDILIRAADRFGPGVRGTLTAAHVACVHVRYGNNPKFDRISDNTGYLVDLLRVLFEQGDPNVVNSNDETILHYMVTTPRRLDVVWIELFDEEDENYMGFAAQFDVGIDSEGKQPAEEGNPIVYDELEKLSSVLVAFMSRLDVNRADGRNSDTILHYLAQLVCGLSVADRSINSDPRAWDEVVWCIKKLLCYQHIDIDIRNRHGYTAFDIIQQATNSLLEKSASDGGHPDECECLSCERSSRSVKIMALWRVFHEFRRYQEARDEQRRMDRKARRLDVDIFSVPRRQQQVMPVLWQRGGVQDEDGWIVGPDSEISEDLSIHVYNVCASGRYLALKLLVFQHGVHMSVAWWNAVGRNIASGNLLHFSVRHMKRDHAIQTPQMNAKGYSHYKITRLLLRFGVCVTSVDPVLSITPMEELLQRTQMFRDYGREYAASLSPRYDHVRCGNSGIIADFVRAGARFCRGIVCSVFQPHRRRLTTDHPDVLAGYTSAHGDAGEPVEAMWVDLDHIRVHEIGMLLMLLHLGEGRGIGINEHDNNGNTIIHWLVGILTSSTGWRGKSMRNLEDVKMLSHVFDLMSPLEFDARARNNDGESVADILRATKPGSTMLSPAMTASIAHFRSKASDFILASYQLTPFLLAVHDERPEPPSHSAWLGELGNGNDCISSIFEQLLL